MLQLFGRHAGDEATPFAAAQHHVIRQHIELLLSLALHVLAADVTKVAAERSFGCHGRDRLDGRGHIHQQGAQIRRALDAAQLLDQKFRERRAAQMHGQTPVKTRLARMSDSAMVDRSSGVNSRSLSANRRLAWRSRARSKALRTLRALAKCGLGMRSARYSSKAGRAPAPKR